MCAPQRALVGLALVSRCLLDKRYHGVAALHAATRCAVCRCRIRTISQHVRALTRAISVRRTTVEQSKMKAGSVDVDRGEQIKWWDAQDALAVCEGDDVDVEVGLGIARECRHSDAVWLTSLFPAGVPVSQERMRDVLLRQRDDPRAMLLAWRLGDEEARAHTFLLERAGELGYAPALVELALAGEDAFENSQRAAMAGDRRGLFHLAQCFRYGTGCEADPAKALALLEEAAALDHSYAQHILGKLAYGAHDWRRFYWWGRAVKRNFGPKSFCSATVQLLPSFETGECGRILHTVGPVLKEALEGGRGKAFGGVLEENVFEQLRRVVELHDAMLGRARQAIDCWSMAGRRCGVVKDIRVMIAKMAWEEAWCWSEKEEVEPAKKARTGARQ
jgi:hypothetical protein